MCECLEVSRSSYYDWCEGKLSSRQAANEQLDVAINNVYQFHGGKYGSPRICRDLKDKGIKPSRGAPHHPQTQGKIER